MGAFGLLLASAALAAGSSFSGSVCSLLSTSQIPSDVQKQCHPQPVDRAIPGEPNYGAIIGNSVAHDIKIVVAKPSSQQSWSLFKQMPSILASATNSKAVAVKVGTWAREVRYVGSGSRHYADVNIVVGAYSCIVLYADPASNANVLVVARAVAAKL